MQTKTKKSVIKSLQQKFESVEYIAGKKNQKAKFILTNYNGNKNGYNPYKNNSRPSLDWTNEMNCICDTVEKNLNVWLDRTTIINKALKLDSITKSLTEFTKKNFNDFQALKLSKNLTRDLFWLEYGLSYELKYRRNQILNVLDGIIANTPHEVKYVGVLHGNKKTFITKSEFLESKELMKDIYRNEKNIFKAKTKILNSSKFKKVYEIFKFKEVTKPNHKSFNISLIKTQLLKRLVIQNNKYMINHEDILKKLQERQITGNENIFNTRLKQTGEFDKFIQLFWKEYLQ